MSPRMRRWTLVLTIAAAECFAWMNRFVLDDAFISFRYAKNLAEGHGLVYNVGERVEGYTNFLWTVIMAVPHLLGIAPDSFALYLGLAIFPVTLTVTYGTARAAGLSFSAAWLAVLILGTNHTFVCFATGGLETQMQTCLLVTAFWLLFRLWKETPPGLSDLAALSLVGSAALLTRLDSAVMLAIAGSAAAWRVVRHAASDGRRPARLAALCLPGLLVTAPWLAWKLYFYGDILPNTYYARVASSVSALRGLDYVILFFRQYMLIPAMVAVILSAPALVRTERKSGILAVAMVFWCAYVVMVGGGFMEFRLLVPMLPLLAILIARALVWLHSPLLRWGVTAIILFGSIHHAATFRWDPRLSLESVSVLKGRLTREHWVDMGGGLAKTFHEFPRCVIATAGAGAIAYYSGLPTVDLLGLNDKWIGREGVVVSDHPGHQRRAYLAYLKARKVNLVIHGLDKVTIRPGPVRFTQADVWRIWKRLALFRPVDVPRDSRIVSIPIGGRLRLLAWYLTRDPRIDRLMKEKGCKIFPIAAKGSRKVQ